MAVGFSDGVGFLAAFFFSKHSLMPSHLLFYHPGVVTVAFEALIAVLESWFVKANSWKTEAEGRRKKEECMWVVAEVIP